ncbi:MAG: ATP-dependent Clp protease proteolytic subunit, partial [Desulfocapsa sp.]|nr:ATP-dependent Clp protease proteolytic subunit [Desulfocapsa sp.]
MKSEKLTGVSASSEDTTKSTPSVGKKKTPKPAPKAKPIMEKKKEKTPPASWPDFIRTADDFDIKDRYSDEIKTLISNFGDDLSNYCCLGLIDPESSISSYDLDQIYAALSTCNPDREKDILLIILSPGGSIEPAYQISKLCKSFAKNKFVVAVPRNAKSAATLISIGADEIHMGPLSQLGPIDPQLDGLPALGVTQALKSIASLSESYPGSSEMFARYLRLALTVEQIGYCERISESAAQYAERLLQKKSAFSKNATEIAHKLVHEYKHHGFVIDLDEAKQILGEKLIVEGSPEIALAESIYKLFDNVNFYLKYYRKKRLSTIGSFESGVLIFNR